MSKLYHIGFAPEDIDGIDTALICGDPERVCKIASLCDEGSARPLAVSREYTSYTAQIDGKRILVISHGIGGPSTAICLEEIYMAGIRTVIRIGTCGGMAMRVCKEDLVIASAAIRAEGTSREYLPIEYPACADFDVVSALRESANLTGKESHVGVVHCKDSFYGQHSPERMPVSYELEAKWRAYIRGGALASEMETATLFTVGAVLGMRVGAVLRAVWNQERIASGLVDDASDDELSAAEVAIGAVRLLLRRR